MKILLGALMIVSPILGLFVAMGLDVGWKNAIKNMSIVLAITTTVVLTTWLGMSLLFN